mgnify:CR=1 FL=1
MTALHDRLRALPLARLAGIRRGVEKESLRATPDSTLALSPWASSASAISSALSGRDET